MLKGDYGKKSFINPITKLVLLVTLPAFLMGGLGGTDAEIFTLIFPLVSLFLLFISKNLKAGMVGLLMYIAVIIAWSVLPSGSDGIFHIILFIVVGIVTGLLPCALMSVYVISSTTASEFITGMKKLFIPDVITIPMSVIFRFFPTVKEEIQAINKAMTMRGIRFGGRNAAGILEYRLIPILMCSLKIGDELSAAALTRGLDSPRKRTNICDTRFRFQDFFSFGTLLLCLFGMGIESIRNSLRGGCETMIELKNVSFTYLSENSDESSAELNGSLSNIDLRIEKGSFVLLTGPSGCGKSTLLRLINGLIPHYYSGKLEGEVVIDGEPVNDKPLCKSAEKIGTVFQNPRSQFFNVDTTSELAFLSENLGVEAEIIKSRIEQTAESFQIKNLLDRSIFHLSDGEKQKIACASIEVGKPEIILLDEPSANLDYHATMQLRKLIAQWVRQGRTVIAAEHRLFYLWDLIDRVVLMDDGKIIKDYNKNELNKLSDNDLSELGLRSAHSPAPTEIELPVVTTDDKTLTINSLRFGYKQGFFNRSKVNNNIIDIHNMELALGKITAITAANGEGKTTFLNCLCGLERRSKDDIIINGAPFKRRNRLNSFFMVMQDTNHQLFTDSVLEEVMISLPEPNEDKALKILESVDLVCYKERHPMALSGGQKQRLAIACAVASERDYILFDEPTSGLDYGHMKEIAALMRQLRNLGKTVIIVTHDSEFIEACCERKVNFVSRG